MRRTIVSVGRGADNLGDVVALAGLHLIAFGAVLFGPVYDGANRAAGIISILVSATACVLVLQAPQRRAVAVSILTVLGAIVGSIAFAAVIPEEVGRPELKGWWAQAIAHAWPHLDQRYVAGAAELLGLSGHMPPNAIAFSALPVPLAAAAIGSVARSRLAFGAWLCVSAVGALIVLGTGSRGSTGGLALGLAVLVVVTFLRGTRAMLVITLASMLGVVLSAVWLFDADVALAGRLDTWASALVDASRAPMSGPGYGAFSNHHPELFNAHNTVLQTLLDLGPLGLAAFTVAVWWSVRAAARIVAWSEEHRTDRRALLLARFSLSCLAGYAVAGMVDSVFTFPAHGSLEWITVMSPIVALILAAPLGLQRDRRHMANRV